MRSNNNKKGREMNQVKIVRKKDVGNVEKRKKEKEGGLWCNKSRSKFQWWWWLDLRCPGV